MENRSRILSGGKNGLSAVGEISGGKHLVVICREFQSDLTDDDIIIRYEENQIVWLTILHASKR